MNKNKNFVLFCKTYTGDFLRFKRLWDSIQKHNIEMIPFYVSVPGNELDFFKNNTPNSPRIKWVSDEEIILANPGVTLDRYKTWDGRLSQQVIKAEFWRYFSLFNPNEIVYLCIDSESIFLKDFSHLDFMTSRGEPFTVMHQNKELLQLASNRNIQRIQNDFLNESLMMKNIFSRQGPNYEFGPTPVIWSSLVWRDLDEKYFHTTGKTIWDAIFEKPSELKWYGEALLMYKSINLIPIDPIMKVYHYDWHFYHCKRNGESTATVKNQYFGILKQSSWDGAIDYGKHAKRKSFLSKLWRKIKSIIVRIK